MSRIARVGVGYNFYVKSTKLKNIAAVMRMRTVVSRGHWQDRDLFGNVVRPFRYPPLDWPIFTHWSFRTNWFPSYTFKFKASVFGNTIVQHGPGKIKVFAK